jgi:membrane protein
VEKGWHETPLTMPGDPHVSAARAAEPGRGRDARGPDEIPFLGWRDIFWRVIEAIPADRVLATSGSVAFFTLLAIFPAVATVVSLSFMPIPTQSTITSSSCLASYLPARSIFSGAK